MQCLITTRAQLEAAEEGLKEIKGSLYFYTRPQDMADRTIAKIKELQ